MTADEAYVTVFDDPDWVSSYSDEKIVIMLNDGIETKELEVTPVDVVNYYHTEARNISSGMRMLAGTYGDWRYIDDLASMCLNYFKLCNRAALEKEGEKYGMKLK